MISEDLLGQLKPGVILVWGSETETPWTIESVAESGFVVVRCRGREGCLELKDMTDEQFHREYQIKGSRVVSTKLTFAAYQAKAYETALPSSKDAQYMLNGLVSEVGEIAGAFKRRQRDGWSDEKTREAALKELGDALWYAAGLATQLGADLGEVAQANLNKVKDRHDRDVIKGSGDER